jgi:hypothetical protein
MLDPEKIPDEIHKLKLFSTVFESRYGKRDEFEEMIEAWSAVPSFLRHRISSIFCDSKHNSDYRIELYSDALGPYDCEYGFAVLIGEYFEHFLLNVSRPRGFNAIQVSVRGEVVVQLDPHWAVDDA